LLHFNFLRARTAQDKPSVFPDKLADAIGLKLKPGGYIEQLFASFPPFNIFPGWY
jgi:hypothetical protein